MTELAHPHDLVTVPPQPDRQGVSMWHWVDWIWHVKGSVAIDPAQSCDEAFDRIEPLFHQVGTTHERNGSTLTFSKKDPVAQDKLATFESGVLRIEREASGLMLNYRLASRMLLFCFLAPLMFLAFAQVTVLISKWEEPKTEAATKEEKKEPAVLPQHAIDKFLGAPAPEKPKKDDKSKEEDKKLKPTASYVFAGLFAFLYIVGRVLEARLVRGLFRKTLQGV